MKRNSIKRIGLSLPVVILLFTTSAYADLGTPLMLFSVFHLLIGNTIIGIIEGIVISKLFQVGKKRSIGIMILANYISMAVGWLGLSLIVNLVKIAVLYNISYIILGLGIASFLLTIIIEWPFCFWILKYKNERRNLSFKASLVVQSISYVLLIPLYFLLSGNGLITNVKIDKSLSFLKSKNAWVYFISVKDGNIYKIKADGTCLEKVKNAEIFDKHVRLFARFEDDKTKLYATGFIEGGKEINAFSGGRVKEESLLLLENLLGKAAIGSRHIGEEWLDDEILDLRLNNQRAWTIEDDPIHSGISCRNSKLGEAFGISLMNPFMAWWLGNITILPGDQVVLQIGDHQIALLDLNSRKIGLITYGNGPLVAIED